MCFYNEQSGLLQKWFLPQAGSARCLLVHFAFLLPCRQHARWQLFFLSEMVQRHSILQLRVSKSLSSSHKFETLYIPRLVVRKGWPVYTQIPKERTCSKVSSQCSSLCWLPWSKFIRCSVYWVITLHSLLGSLIFSNWNSINHNWAPPKLCWLWLFLFFHA